MLTLKLEGGLQIPVDMLYYRKMIDGPLNLVIIKLREEPTLSEFWTRTAFYK